MSTDSDYTAELETLRAEWHKASTLGLRCFLAFALLGIAGLFIPHPATYVLALAALCGFAFYSRGVMYSRCPRCNHRYFLRVYQAGPGSPPRPLFPREQDQECGGCGLKLTQTAA